jgi:hypothetical protein
MDDFVVFKIAIIAEGHSTSYFLCCSRSPHDPDNSVIYLEYQQIGIHGDILETVTTPHKRQMRPNTLIAKCIELGLRYGSFNGYEAIPHHAWKALIRGA